MKNYFYLTQKRHCKNCKGFGLIEVLLSIFLVGICAAITIPVFINYQTKNDLDSAVNTSAQVLRRAQSLARAVEGDSQWGVKFQSSSIILFKGSVFSGRDANFDENYGISPNIVIGGNSEIIYNKFSGSPGTTGSTTLTLGNDSKTLSLDSNGTITY